MSSINGPGSVEVDTVDCPQDQVPKIGTTFTCSYELTDGSAGEITVTVRDEEGAGSWEVTRPASGQAEQVVLTGYEREIGRKPKSVELPRPAQGRQEGEDRLHGRVRERGVARGFRDGEEGRQHPVEDQVAASPAG